MKGTCPPSATVDYEHSLATSGLKTISWRLILQDGRRIEKGEVDLCKACGDVGEDEQHVLLDCQYYAGVCAKSAKFNSDSCLAELFGRMDQLRVANFVAACLGKHDSMLAKCRGSVHLLFASSSSVILTLSL